jgi:hypothetical protein
LTKFGDITQNINFGSKYKFVPNSNPPPGAYESSRGEDYIRPRSPSPYIRERIIPESLMRKKESVPENYPAHEDVSARIKTKIDFGRKYEFKTDRNPAPG